MVSGMPWIKLYNEFLDDPKIGRLPESAQLLFIKLLLIAGECDAEGHLVNGDTALSIEDIAWRLRLTEQQISDSLQDLRAAGLMALNDAWVVVNFAKRQDRPQSDKRALWRARQQVKRKGLRPIVFERDGGHCGYCGKQLSEDSYVLDHIIPPDQGGDSELTNLVTACSSCNTKKAGRTPEDADMPILESHKVGNETVTAPSQPSHSPRAEQSRAEDNREEVEEEQSRVEEEAEQTAAAAPANALQAMLELKVLEATARKYERECAASVIMAWCSEIKARGDKVGNPAGLLVKMLRDGIPPPEPRDNGWYTETEYEKFIAK